MKLLGLILVLLPVWAYAVGAVWAAGRFSRIKQAESADQPPVSIWKPLHGDESWLYENLQSVARQDYPAFQIVMGVRNPADQALPAARRLIAERPENDITAVVDPRVNGSNLKI